MNIRDDMKVLSIMRVTEYIVETNSNEFPTYRTDGNGNWENLMGDSWEPLFYPPEELEEDFQFVYKKLYDD